MEHRIVLTDTGEMKPVTARIFLISAARKLGFVRDPLLSDANAAAYVKTFTDKDGYPRRLEIQFWKDGQHRVSHGVPGFGFNTIPTPFTDLEGMYLAIAKEQTRRDNKAYQQVPKKLTFNDVKKHLFAHPELKAAPSSLYDDAAWDDYYDSNPKLKDMP